MPQFNREPLELETAARGLTCRYLGTELGGRPTDPQFTTEGQPDYEKVAHDPRLLETLEKVVAVAGKRNVVLMCSENDPATCHRAKLLGRVLASRFATNAQHITRSGLIAQLDVLPEQTSLF